MISKIKFYENPKNGGAYFLESIIYGETYLQDKHSFDCIGFVKYNPRLNKWELCETDEEFAIYLSDSREEAEEFGRKYFNCTN